MPGKRKSKTLHFKSKSGFKKYAAYGHIHGVMGKHRSGYKYPKVKIRGKNHRVKH